MKTKIVPKMKKSTYKSGMLLIPIFCLISLTLTAQEVTKEYHKEFAAAPGTTLDISNKYGNVIIQSWNKDQIIIDIKVTVEMPDKQKAEKLLGYIDVQFNEADNRISAKTLIDDNFNFSGWGSGSRKFSIVYNVKIPVEADLNLSNRYGDTEIDELQGSVNLDIKYGNLTVEKLTRENKKPLSKLSVAYGKASIDEAGWLDLYIRYSPGFEISNSQALLLDSRYSKIQIGKTSSLVGESRYDKVRIEDINNLVLENGYTDVNVGLLTKTLDYNGSYGSFTTERIPEGFESINIESRYTGVRLGIEESANYKLDAKVSYGGLKINEDNFKYQKRIIENNSNETSGIIGKGENPASMVKVEASYGSVKLY